MNKKIQPGIVRKLKKLSDGIVAPLQNVTAGELLHGSSVLADDMWWTNSHKKST